MIFNGFGVLLWVWAISGARRAAGGAPRREMTRKKQPKAQKWAPFWHAFGSWKHRFAACVFMCFSGPLFIARFAVWGDLGSRLGRHLGSLGPLEIMPKCTTVRSFRVWGLFVRSLFPELLLEGVWHAFSEILVPIGAPIGAPCGYFWQLFQGLILEAVLGWQKRVKNTGNAMAGGRGGAC